MLEEQYPTLLSEVDAASEGSLATHLPALCGCKSSIHNTMF